MRNSSPSSGTSSGQAQRLDLSGFSNSAPAQPLRLLFLHHSVGGQWLAAPGPEEGTNPICATNPNGGSLRAALQSQGYQVHEASYGSRIGENTDIFDWPGKFRDQMDAILACDLQNQSYTNGERNQVVMFKSCFPNNDFRGPGRPPGNAAGPELTIWNARAAYASLLEQFRKHPDVLFVCVTAPPLAAKPFPSPLWKRAVKALLGRSNDYTDRAALAREFNNWLSSTNGWLAEAPRNVVVFDYYDVLTGHGASNLSVYSTVDGYDSHPSAEGNRRATEEFIPFLNRAVQRAGIAP
ncbi:MAG: SGNH/GDSL hydrolase family protein [Verrucomicrobiota bacterium]